MSCRLPAAGSARRWAVCIGAVLLAACGLHIAVLRIRAERHSSEAERSYKMLWSLYERRPPDASKQEWEHSVSFLVISHMNVFVDPFHGSYDALRRFGDQLDAKLKDPIDRSIVEWVWDRMAETSPQGTQYIERFRPEPPGCRGMSPGLSSVETASEMAQCWVARPESSKGVLKRPRLGA